MEMGMESPTPGTPHLTSLFMLLVGSAAATKKLTVVGKNIIQDASFLNTTSQTQRSYYTGMSTSGHELGTSESEA